MNYSCQLLIVVLQSKAFIEHIFNNHNNLIIMMLKILIVSANFSPDGINNNN